MPIGAFGVLLINIGASLVLGELTRKRYRPRIGQFDGPTAEADRHLPIPFGNFAISPNVVWWQASAPSAHGQVVDYSANMLMRVCHNTNIVELSDIQFGGKSIRMAPTHADGGNALPGTAFISPSLPYLRPGSADTPATFDVQAVRFFGGGVGEGGIGGADSGTGQGQFRFYWGGLNQPADQLTVTSYAGLPVVGGQGVASGRPGVCYVAFGTHAIPQAPLSPVTETLFTAISFPGGAPPHSYFASHQVSGPPYNLINVSIHNDTTSLNVPVNTAYVIVDTTSGFVRIYNDAPGVSNGDHLTITFTPVPDAVGTTEEFFWSQNVSTPKDVILLGRAIPRALYDLNLTGYGPGMSTSTPEVNGEANGAEIIYAIVTNTEYGLGKSNGTLDLASFVTAAKNLTAEGLGLSPTFSDAQSAEDMIDEVCRHLGARLYESTRTGKLTLILERASDTPSATTITVSNTSDLVVTRPVARRVNSLSVRYREFAIGPSVAQVGELLTSDLVFTQGAVGLYRTQSPFASIVVHDVTKATILTLGTDYGVVPGLGIVLMLENSPNTDAHDVIEVDYLPLQGFFGFKDKTHTPAQDLGLIATEGPEHLTEDCPFFSNVVTVGMYTARRFLEVSQNLAVARFSVDRSGSDLEPGSVVPITWAPFGLTNARFRVLNVDPGTLENGKIQIEAVEDVFGATVMPTLPSDPTQGIGGVTPAPVIAISYVSPSSIRVGLFPADPSFKIQLQSATDGTGTGQGDLSPVGGLTYNPSTPYYDDAHTIGQTWYYRARLLAKAGYTDGPWTGWMAMTGVAGTPGSPSCTAPTWGDTPSATPTLGTLDVVVTDPQGRLIEVAFSTQTATGAPTAFVADTAPYQATVAIVAGQTSIITRRITYLDCTPSVVVSELAFSYPLSVPPDPTPTASLTAVPVEVAVITEPRGYVAVPVGLQALAAGRQDTPDLSGFGSAYVVATVSLSTMPVGAYVAFQQLNTVGTWVYLDGLDGPKLAIDTASVATFADGVLVASAVSLAAASQIKARIRPVIVGGNASGSVIFDRLGLWLNAVPADPTPPEGGPLPPSCEFAAISLSGYANLAAMLADGWTLSDPEGIATFTLDATHVLTSTIALKEVIDKRPVADPYSYSLTKVFPGYVPGQGYRIPASQYPDANGSGFVWTSTEGVWTELPTTLGTLYYPDASGNITAGFFFNITGLGSPGSPYSPPKPTVWFDGLKITTPACFVDPTPGGGGGGGGGTDPIPPPTPVIGTHPYGAFSIDVGGSGYWNSTVKRIDVGDCVTMLNRGAAGGMLNIYQPMGPEAIWNPGGNYSQSAALRQLDLLAANPAANAAILARVADHSAFAALILDEPQLVARYGRVISDAEISELAHRIASYWPGWRMTVRAPSSAHSNIPGICWWAQWRMGRGGGVTAFLNNEVADATAKGAELIVGINVANFDTGRRAITPAEYVNYGTIMASHPYPISFYVWQYESAWYSQTGMPKAVHDVGVTFQAAHP